MEHIRGKVYDIQGFSVHDGPGIRVTVFLKGCPLRCPWCHSPESQAFKTELNWMELRCVGIELCGKCIAACPRGAVSPGKTKNSLTDGKEFQVVWVDREKCDDCGECAKVCGAKALYLCGTDYTAEQILERVLKDVPFFKRSGGGITISGGECLRQPRFTLELLKLCKENSIHTAVDTTGYVAYDVIEPILPCTDLFLYDLKCMDSALHEKVIEVSNELILENAKKIAANGGKMQIRIPVIPLFNDSIESFEQFGRFILELGDAVETVQLLPYHKMGTVKYERLQKQVPVFEAEPPSQELVDERKEYLENLGINVMIH